MFCTWSVSPGAMWRGIRPEYPFSACRSPSAPTRISPATTVRNTPSAPSTWLYTSLVSSALTARQYPSSATT